MAEIYCYITIGTDKNDSGIECPCTFAVCSLCCNETQSWGDDFASLRHCLALMSEKCPMDENNFYVAE